MEFQPGPVMELQKFLQKSMVYRSNVNAFHTIDGDTTVTALLPVGAP